MIKNILIKGLLLISTIGSFVLYYFLCMWFKWEIRAIVLIPLMLYFVFIIIYVLNIKIEKSEIDNQYYYYRNEDNNDDKENISFREIIRYIRNLVINKIRKNENVK